MPPQSAVYAGLVGTTIGRLYVESYEPRSRRLRTSPTFACRCECGSPVRVIASNLVRPNGTKSCGCLAAEMSSQRRTTHGMSNSPEWLAWKNMKSRCYENNHQAFKRYGGRGVTVCQRWLESFEAFFQDVGRRPSPGHSLDRFPDNNGNYEPGNVRWATRIEQQNNTRSNRTITVDGVTLTVSQWAKRAGMRVGTVFRRLKKGWSDEEAVTTPLRRTV